jgi:GT2 family glycosyltransferase
MRFSVIVPVHNHWSLVPKLLHCLRKQTIPGRDFEIIIVDNGSSDFAPPEELPENTRIERCPTPGSYAARNHAAEQAAGDWFAFTDADCLPAPDWLERLWDAAQTTDHPTLLAGSINMVSASAKPGPLEIYDMVKGIPQERYVRGGYAATANLTVPRQVFQEVGGFDGTRFSGGDADLCRGAGALGYPIVYVPEARVDHPSRTTWEQISTKARRIKGGQLMAGTKRRRRAWLLRTLMPPLVDAWRFLGAKEHSLRHRMTAIGVLIRVWFTELAEILRLAVGQEPERS